MALRTDIPLNVRAPDVGQIFNDALGAAQGFQNIRQQPLRNRLLENRADTADVALEGQRRLGRATDIAFGGAEILPNLKSGNFDAVGQQLASRRQRLINEGKPTETTDEAIALLNTNPQELLNKTNQIVSVAQQQGVLKGQAQPRPVTLGLGEKLVSPVTGETIASGGVKPEGKTQPRVDKLRSRFDVFSKDLLKVDASARKIETASDNAQGDMSLIFGFMKLLDPGSTVREGEFKSAEVTEGIPGRILNIRNRLLSGERLNDAQRQEFKDEAKKLVTAQQASFDGQIALILQQADQDNVSRSKVIGTTKLREFEKRAADALIQNTTPSTPEVDPALLEFMTPEEKALFNGS